MLRLHSCASCRTFEPMKLHALAAFLYFSLSTIFTWWFVSASPLYISEEQMFLSSAIAGGKWAIQIVAALLLLSDCKWGFIRNISRVCFAGSCLLLPYVWLKNTPGMQGATYFIGSLAVSVAAMVALYYYAVKSAGAAISWWGFWLLCLATAITLQLTVVFHVL